MHYLTRIDTLLEIGLAVAAIAIGVGVRGVYSVAAISRRERSNQATTELPIDTAGPTRKQANAPQEKRRKAA
ncbi:MAG TPA: hypothetical protein VGN12_10720 [Pirellulales bacterium]|jgi:hypothetical protein